MAAAIPCRRWLDAVQTSIRYALQTPSESRRAIPTTRSPSCATTTCCDCSNERRSASGDRPLSKSSAARSAFACAQSTPSSNRGVEAHGHGDEPTRRTRRCRACRGRTGRAAAASGAAQAGFACATVCAVRTRTFSRAFGSFRRCGRDATSTVRTRGTTRCTGTAARGGARLDRAPRSVPTGEVPGCRAGDARTPSPPAAVTAATMAAPSLNATSGTAGVGAGADAERGRRREQRAQGASAHQRQPAGVADLEMPDDRPVEPGPADTGGVGGERGREPRAVGAVHGCRGGGDDRAAMVGQYALDDALRHLEASRDLRRGSSRRRPAPARPAVAPATPRAPA